MNTTKAEIEEYASLLVKGTLDIQEKIDSLISAHSSHWKIDRMPVTDRNILRMGTYELLEEQTVPPKAVINEAIEIAKKSDHGFQPFHQRIVLIAFKEVQKNFAAS